MVLDPTHRGMLEQLIDEAIQTMPNTVNFVRNYRYSKILKDKDADDFVLGFVVGRIDTTLKAEFITTQNRDLTDDELKDIDNKIYNRMDELKEAIFKCG